MSVYCFGWLESGRWSYSHRLSQKGPVSESSEVHPYTKKRKLSAPKYLRRTHSSIHEIPHNMSLNRVVIHDGHRRNRVTNRHDGRIDKRTHHLGIWRVCIKIELYAQIRFFILSPINIVCWHGMGEGEVDFHDWVWRNSMGRIRGRWGRARQGRGVHG